MNLNVPPHRPAAKPWALGSGEKEKKRVGSRRRAERGSLWLQFSLEGIEGVMPCSRSREDLVAVVPLISNQYPRLWKKLKQQVSRGEVAALPFAEMKEDRWSFTVAD